MRILFVALALCALGCKKSQVAEVKKAAEEARTGDTAATRYVETLQQDVKKADDAVSKTNAASQQSQEAVEELQKAEEAGQ
ncbi:MAG: hypothetical protein WC943_11155 [Elusimicrobiota bacterium]|jgi:TRAP-type uncharacterized transport system substrate-binding protein